MWWRNCTGHGLARPPAWRAPLSALNPRSLHRAGDKVNRRAPSARTDSLSHKAAPASASRNPPPSHLTHRRPRAVTSCRWITDLCAKQQHGRRRSCRRRERRSGGPGGVGERSGGGPAGRRAGSWGAPSAEVCGSGGAEVGVGRGVRRVPRAEAVGGGGGWARRLAARAVGGDHRRLSSFAGARRRGERSARSPSPSLFRLAAGGWCGEGCGEAEPRQRRRMKTKGVAGSCEPATPNRSPTRRRECYPRARRNGRAPRTEAGRHRRARRGRREASRPRAPQRPALVLGVARPVP